MEVTLTLTLTLTLILTLSLTPNPNHRPVWRGREELLNYAAAATLIQALNLNLSKR